VTTTICNICKVEIPPGTPSMNAFKGKATLRGADGDGILPFTFNVEITVFQFNTSNFHVCKKCIVEAVFKGKAE